MIEIEFYDDGRIIKGFLLGKYRREIDEPYSYKKKFLWKTKTMYASRMVDTQLYVIFIPWKHQLKELREVEEKYIVDPKSIDMDKTWIKKEIFVSEGLDSGYPISFDVKDFAGYKFMCDNKRFITGLCLHEFDYCLTILYKNMPELLNADLNNVEE